MTFLADLHTHSHFSRATSSDCTLEGLHAWAQRKGVRVVGAGDFTHPGWFEEMRAKLAESAPGLFRLRPGAAAEADKSVPDSCRGDVHFMITGEISSIYKRDGLVRKVHSLLLAPDFPSAEGVLLRLDRLGNIRSDGRPILGLDPRDLVSIILDIHPQACLIPAHVWTPWFSMLGSKSGFDSPQECFGDLMPHVFAAETGLSSDPPMNWRVSSMDPLCLVSNSDLHSPRNMARNANVFNVEPDYFAMLNALRSKDPARSGGTIDLFPEEGKYHADGHRKCGVCLEPEETLARKGLCPACGKPLVLGVLHRVVALADRPKGARPASALPCRHIIPLDELLAEIYECGASSKKVCAAYDRLLGALGPEMSILLDLDLEALRGREPALLAEAVRRVREERVIRRPGYDGEYGVIRVFEPGEKDRLLRQATLFPSLGTPAAQEAAPRSRRRPAAVSESASYYLTPDVSPGPAVAQTALFGAAGALDGLDAEQRAAAEHVDGPVIIVAGPGAGKTRTLTHRIAHLVRERDADPRRALAVTFTNRAAGEMRGRLRRLLGPAAEAISVTTFHALAFRLLRRHADAAGLAREFALVSPEEEKAILRSRAGLNARQAEATMAAIQAARRDLEDPGRVEGYNVLRAVLAEDGLVSLDELIPRCVRLLRDRPEARDALGCQWLCVDEYQDVDRAQYELVRQLCPDGRGLCVIGDPDQAIYGFRGADVGFFLRFEQDFPGARVFRLGRNYRSSEAVVTAAGQVVASSRTAMSVAALAAQETGVRVRFHRAATPASEAEFIAREIERWLGGSAFFSMDSERVAADHAAADVGLGDVAVLVRLRALMEPLAEALTRLGLPVQAVGEGAFMDRPGALRIVQDLRRSIAASGDRSPADALANPSLEAGLAAAGRETLAECRRLAAAFPGGLADFLDHLLLRQSADGYDERAERVALLTLHAAKGLEFPIVFIAGCEAGIVPYARPGEPPNDDEERRLLYVGMTRAARVLYLTCARKRTLFGRAEARPPSPFLREIEEGLRQEMRANPARRRSGRRQLEIPFGD